MMETLIKYLQVIFISSFYIPYISSKEFNDIRFRGPPESDFYPTVHACFSKFVGSKGSIQSPVLTRGNEYPFDCEWDIVVADSNKIEFEFETFNLPKSREKKCESYIELFYVKNQDGMTKRLFCPYDLVDKIYIDSNIANLRFHSGESIEGNDSYGFKINYNAISEDTSSTYPAATIVLISFATLIILTVCVICIRSHRKFPSIGPIPSHLVVPAAAPNAPTRAELQSAFDFHLRELTQAPQNGSRYMSRTCPDVSDYSDRRKASIPYQNPEDRRGAETFVVTTPRSVFPSPRRIADLRTRLVARFSSVSSSNESDRSIFLSASSQMDYSRLDSEDERKEVDPEVKEEGGPKTEIRRSAGSGGKNVPSIVIEFFK